MNFKHYILLFILGCVGCQDFGQLIVIADLPQTLKEASGNEIIANDSLIWMINDGGNTPTLFAISKKGKIKKEIAVQAKNQDWEDITSDDEGNLYIGDFGNNLNKRKNLVILKIDKKYLDKKTAEVEKINFKFENQQHFPPKKDNRYFDTEAFFYHNNQLYIFTKSRVKNKFGKTFLYKIPAKKGNYQAKLIGEYNNGKNYQSWITSADISNDNTKVALLSQKNVLIFSDFKDDNFLSGKVKEIPLTHQSQKEGICFADNDTSLLISEENPHNFGGNLYQLTLNK